MHFREPPATLQSVLALYWKGVESMWANLTGCSPPLQSSQLALKRTYSASACAEAPRSGKPGLSQTSAWMFWADWIQASEKSQVCEVWCLIAHQLQRNWKTSTCVLPWGKNKLPIPFSELTSLCHYQSISRVSNTAELHCIAGILARSHPWTPRKLYRKVCIREASKDDMTLQTGD